MFLRTKLYIYNSVSVDINVTENSGKNNIRPNNHKVFVNFDNLEDKVLWISVDKMQGGYHAFTIYQMKKQNGLIFCGSR